MNSLPLNGGNALIKVGFKTGETGTFQFMIDEINGLDPQIKITLEDLKTDELTDLRKNSCHLFTASPGDDPKRFLLHLSTPAAVNEEVEGISIRIISSGQSIVVENENNSEAGLISVYDLQGKTLFYQFIKESEKVIIPGPFSPGIYLAKVVYGNRLITRKIYIH